MEKNKVDAAVLSLLTKVREKKEAIKKLSKRPQWKTNCSLPTGENGRTNIQTVRDEGILVSMCAVLLSSDRDHVDAAKLLGLDYNKEFSGYPLSDWIDDLKTRASMLNIDKQKKEIETLDKRINKLVSSEQRREMELRELEELLKD